MWLSPASYRVRWADCVATPAACTLAPPVQERSLIEKGGSHETMAYRPLRAAQPIGIRATIGAGDSLRLGSESPEAAAGHASRRGRRRRGQLQEAHLRLFARRL